jgi:hypothetical protein
MIQDTTLRIRLIPGSIKPPPEFSAINELTGGPETLLRWLETQLGLPIRPFHEADRITEYANALDQVSDGVISASLAVDRWATATELLHRRDELLLAGWDEKDSTDLPPLVRDLAAAAEQGKTSFLPVAKRLNGILSALSDGQTLPSHRCILYDPVENWPSSWRQVLEQLQLESPEKMQPAAAAGSSLHSAQMIIGGGDAVELEQNESLRYVHTRSDTAAVELVVSTLAADPSSVSKTVIYCEDEFLAARIDAALNRVGLPTCGVASRSCAHPVLQILPLSLSLCWDPVDPQLLLDFLTLPVSPLPRRANSKLAAALAEQPGLGSESWELALHDVCEAGDEDTKEMLRERIDAWLSCERTPRGKEISTKLIRNRCNLVAQWSSARASVLDETDSDLTQALRTAAGQAALLGDLAQSQGSSLSEPQLARIIEEAIGSGIQTTAFYEAEGGPTLVHSLAEIHYPCKQLIWLGLGSEDVGGGRWSANQLRQLREAGIDLDDGTHRLTSLRSAEARGFSYVEEAILAILIPQDHAKHWHPLWLAIREQLPKNEVENPLVIEDLVAAGEGEALAPFNFTWNESSVEPSQPRRPLWTIPPGLIKDRDRVSASELQDRLACPLKWTLNYQAKLHASTITELPSDFLLKGNFCHSVLERVFGEGGDLPTVSEAVAAVGKEFDERLPLDAAPLAQPIQHLEKQSLRSELVSATRTLIETLADGGYHIVGLEMDLTGEAFGKTLIGSVDCVAVRENGDEAIVDFKYAGRNKYRDLIEEGKAVQLATYAYGRSLDGGKFPAVAYLVLCDSRVFTPSGSSIVDRNSSAVIPASSIRSVWETFVQAVENADGWLTNDEPIPARPLQLPNEWPPGAEIVLKDKLAANTTQDVCKYCDYQTLCGLQELS